MYTVSIVIILYT